MVFAVPRDADGFLDLLHLDVMALKSAVAIMQSWGGVVTRTVVKTSLE